jgi:tRNA threonylcarbamoyladenosine biosynthesis protein TsaE
VTDTEGLRVAEVGPAAVEPVLDVIRAAFADRPTLDPPSTALEETVESVAAVLAQDGGLLATLDGRPVGALLFGRDLETLRLRRVSVVPEAQQQGVARALLGTALDVGRARGLRRVSLLARAELPATVAFWTRAGFGRLSDGDGVHLTLGLELPVACEVRDAEAMRELGRRVSGALRAGDLVILTGELGAGKTTFAQGVGAGLGVRGDVTSPTFVISRVHRGRAGGPALVHVDAYRLADGTELDDLDLDDSLPGSVTLVEWGEGLAEGLTEDRLEVAITRSSGDGAAGAPPDDMEVRTVRLTPVGGRWVGSDVADLVG